MEMENCILPEVNLLRIVFFELNILNLSFYCVFGFHELVMEKSSLEETYSKMIITKSKSSIQNHQDYIIKKNQFYSKSEESKSEEQQLLHSEFSSTTGSGSSHGCIHMAHILLSYQITSY